MNIQEMAPCIAELTKTPKNTEYNKLGLDSAMYSSLY
jgi:hypothetical protein